MIPTCTSCSTPLLWTESKQVCPKKTCPCYGKEPK